MKITQLGIGMCALFAAHIQSEVFIKQKKHGYDPVYDGAIENWQQTIAQDPSDLNAHFNLGHAYLATGRLPNALDEYRTMLSSRDAYLKILHNYAYTLEMNNDFDAAIDLYSLLVDIKPDYTIARYGLAFALLKKGDFKKAWRAHYWNLVYQGKHAPKFHEYLKTNSLHDKHILLIPEGGLGDTINFIRYAKRLKDHGAYVAAMVQKPLFNLLSCCNYIDELQSDADPIYLPHHARVTFISLPALFEDEEDAFTDEMPYIFADPSLVKIWHNKVKDDHNFKVGISWQSSIENDATMPPLNRRGIHLEDLMILADIPNVSFYSLQKHDGVDQINNAFPLKVFEQFDEKNGPFMDTAALMESMDLVIAVDSAVAHLAGAMGKKVWTLLPFSADWRWIHGRTTTPWYPTMRLFRQHQPLDWHGALKDIHDALIKEVKDAML